MGGDGGDKLVSCFVPCFPRGPSSIWRDKSLVCSGIKLSRSIISTDACQVAHCMFLSQTVKCETLFGTRANLFEILRQLIKPLDFCFLQHTVSEAGVCKELAYAYSPTKRRWRQVAMSQRMSSGESVARCTQCKVFSGTAGPSCPGRKEIGGYHAQWLKLILWCSWALGSMIWHNYLLIWWYLIYSTSD